MQGVAVNTVPCSGINLTHKTSNDVRGEGVRVLTTTSWSPSLFTSPTSACRTAATRVTHRTSHVTRHPSPGGFGRGASHSAAPERSKIDSLPAAGVGVGCGYWF